MPSKSIFQRIRDFVFRSTEQAIKEKEVEAAKPLPTTESAKKSWLKRQISKISKLFIRKQEEEITEEIEKLEKRQEVLRQKLATVKTQKPQPQFKEVKPVPETFVKAEPEALPEAPSEKPRKKTPDDFLINDPEFAFERGRMVGAMKYLEEKMQKFADGEPFAYEDTTLHPPTTEVVIDKAPLADGSVIVQARFQSVWGDDEDDFRQFTLMLEAYLHSLGPLYRVSIAQQWDPSKLTVPYDIKEGTLNNKPGYDFYKGMLDIAQNVSLRIADSFDTVRDFEGFSGLRDKLGYPDFLTVRLVWGESVVRMARLAAKI